jgi:cytoskeletal protein CcmA (bactofilin family)
MTMFKRTKKPSSRIDTLIGKSVRVNGDIEFTGGLHVDGYVGGNVRATGGTGAAVSVSEHGHIEGSVESPQVVLNGHINGDIIALERVVLGAKARVEGDIYYGSIEMALGAEISGKLIPQKPDAARQETGGDPQDTLLHARV